MKLISAGRNGVSEFVQRATFHHWKIAKVAYIQLDKDIPSQSYVFFQEILNTGNCLKRTRYRFHMQMWTKVHNQMNISFCRGENRVIDLSEW